ncbi:MAG: hypothetical protein AAB275_07505 [Deltaproteobacteria bacterium]
MINECPEVFDCLDSFEEIVNICPYDAKCGKCQHWVEPFEEEGVLKGRCLKRPTSGFFLCSANACEIYLLRGSRASSTKSLEVLDMERDELKCLLREILDETLGVSEVSIGKKWEGGEMVLKPGNRELQEKTIPIEAFFHKIVMLRDRLRVLEQKINAHTVLTDEEKVDLQQYITRIYGSLTTFNVFFADKGEQFVGDKGKE